MRYLQPDRQIAIDALSPARILVAMKNSPQAQVLLGRIAPATTKLGDLQVIAKEIKKDHALAMELWSNGGYMARQLALRIMDAKQLDQQAINALDKDMAQHPPQERHALMDRLMADQLAKDKRLVALMHTWADSPSALQRRTFWYHQARLRWVGQPSPQDTEQLLTTIEQRIEGEKSEVQWAMNFTAAQIGIFQPQHRARVIALGERTGLYKDEVVAKNCTPSYLPLFIASQVKKLGK